MSNTVTVRLDEKLAQKLHHVAEHSGRTKSEVIRDALRRQLAIAMLDEVREELVPVAEKRGWYTDEDVFRDIS
jgi:predicted transcriptional regulator